MTVTLKQLENLARIVKQRQQRRQVMKDRIQAAQDRKHRETCSVCRDVFNALQEVKAYHEAGVETQNLMENLLSNKVH